jgi:dethiobiotin synthetase
MRQGLFVTGTDTGVGKTLAACAIIHALRTRGRRPVPMKPIAAGAVERDGKLVNEDTVRLLAAAGLDASWSDAVTPVLLRQAVAPHIAADNEGRAITLGFLPPALTHLASAGDCLVAEGVGGFRVPLGARLDTVDLARAIGLPVVLVVGLRLGCLNHALLSGDAVRAARLRLVGWIANAIDPHMAARDENVAALRERLRAPLLGVLPYVHDPDAKALSLHLDAGAVLAACGGLRIKP